ncbi:metallo-beta-lactamase superfamily protein [Colletotrichum scovillei]|uniref:ribonuclease Z n=1 Tax=Colletotrichum scovillei TaxID=1209932 RepID=A0A9P7R679_9PEZI|nr:metallo-beta-lactamase superfamily protein [Colletotrichum scovillei]KAG7069977.1 metallo-beta-lactamase superfamily protein [Colletotrichum scovillei]KAG7078230.1 metallo-beta-lactamase superfamily protein [Colletotrichum scovillei]
MSAIRSSSSALLLLGGVATLPGAATVRSQFPQRSSTTVSTTAAEQAELGYMQQPLGPASSRTTTHTAANSKRSGGAASGLGWQATQAKPKPGDSLADAFESKFENRVDSKFDSKFKLNIVDTRQAKTGFINRENGAKRRTYNKDVPLATPKSTRTPSATFSRRDAEPFGRDAEPSRRDEPFRRDEKPFRRYEEPFSRNKERYHRDEPFRRDDRDEPFRRDEKPFRRDRPYRRNDEPFGRNKERREPFQQKYALNTNKRGTRPLPTADFLASIVGHKHPGGIARRDVVRGDPESFPNKRVFCLPANWNKVSAKIPDSWIYCADLIQGPETEQTQYTKLPPAGEKKDIRAAMTNYFQIAATPTADTGPALMLHFDQRRYLFGNIAEGTQRALSQRKVSLGKLEVMFISGATIQQNTGGMIGMMLTVADVLDGSRREVHERNQARKGTGKKLIAAKGPERIEIHGAQNLAYSVATARGFVFRKGLPIRAVELYEDPRIANPDANTPDWQDELIQVWKVPIASDHVNQSRKRSHEVMTAEDEGLSNPAGAVSAKEQAVIDREAIKGVVESMFNSSWTMDKLYETKLSQVQLPATIFVREDGNIKKYQGPMPGGDEPVPDLDVLVRYPWPAATVEKLPSASISNTAVTYIVKNKGRRGKFNAAAAKELGVKPTDNKKLTDGVSVQGKDGITVTPEMVLEAPIKPQGFTVIDIADASYIDSFLGRPEWQNANLMDGVHVFNWILGPTVIDDPRIQQFMKERPDVQHLVMSTDTSPNMLALDSYAILHGYLRQIDPDRFPQLAFNNTVRDLSHIGPNVETARVGMKAKLSPAYELVKDEIVPPIYNKFKGNGMEEGVIKLAKEAADKIKEPAFLRDIEEAEKDIPNRDTEIIPLGTGSAVPSKYRNVSATLVRVPQYGNYLFDCGENTLGQLQRTFGAEETNKILQETRCIFISHMHADHHLGTARFLRAWNEATIHLSPQPQLGLIGPAAMQYFLMEYSRIEPIAFGRVKLIRKGHFFPHDEGLLPADCPTRLASAQLVPVNHCKDAYAGVLTWPSGLKIAYSGDCRPSERLVEAGKGATLLIHESTFDNDKMGDAVAKKHSTLGEALKVASNMGARRVLLTHFSQRYAKLPLVEDRKTDDGADQAVLMAWDQMRVKLGEFRQAQAFLPAISRYVEHDAFRQDADE